MPTARYPASAGGARHGVLCHRDDTVAEQTESAAVSDRVSDVPLQYQLQRLLRPAPRSGDGHVAG